MIAKLKNHPNEFALIIGHLLGDGGINNQGRVYYCNSEDFLIKEFVTSMNKMFNISPWIKKEKKITRVVYPVRIGRELWSLFGKFSFGKDTKTITPEIKSLPLEWKTKILQAWFNDDGSVIYYPPNYKVIAIHQKLKNLLNFIKEILIECDIESKIEEDDGKWLLRIFGYQNLLNFRDKINFSYSYRKREKLDVLIKSINHPHNLTKTKILSLLEDSPKSTKALSESLKMNRYLIYGHLHGWKRKTKKSSSGLIDSGRVMFKRIGKDNIYTLIEYLLSNFS